jgi:tRNA pseudouridine55 synthase
MNGVLIIDKSPGLTSHDVVNRVRRILGQRSVGHLGTLDPMASGVLPLVTGGYTRLAQFYLSAEKTYEGTVRFGFSTDTYDAEGDPTSTPQPVSLNKEEIEVLAERFRGIIEQTPPPFSAKKIKGVPAYKLARKQKQVILQPVEVEIKEFEIRAVEADRVQFRARVASGTYMRSVAHDMGKALGCGAHLESLRRTSVAEFTLADAHTLDELAEAAGTRTRVRAHSPAIAEGHAGNPTETAVGDLSREAAEECSLPAKRWGEGEKQAAKDRDSIPGSAQESLGPNTSPRRTPDGNPPVPLTRKPDHYGLRSVALPERSADFRPDATREKLFAAFFIHPRKLLPQFPSVTADEPTTARIRSGRTVNLPELTRARQVKVFAGQRQLIAIATRVAGTLFHAKIVLCATDAPSVPEASLP